MTKPYEPAMLTSDAGSPLIGQPWIVCAIASIVAMPIWFVVLIAVASAIRPVDNPAGIPIYGIMCLALSAIVLPINTKLIAPMLAKLTFAPLAGAMVVHAIVGTAVFALLWLWPTTIGKMPSLTWTIIPYYLSVFLLPPMLIGSTAYSLRYVALNRGMRPNQSRTVISDGPPYTS